MGNMPSEVFSGEACICAGKLQLVSGKPVSKSKFATSSSMAISANDVKSRTCDDLELKGSKGLRNKIAKEGANSLLAKKGQERVRSYSLGEPTAFIQQSSSTPISVSKHKTSPGGKEAKLEIAFGRLTVNKSEEGQDFSDETSAAAKDLPEDVLYYGWFYSAETSSVINSTVMFLFRECFHQVDQFQRFILTCCKDKDVKDPFEYYGYKRPGKPIKPDEEIEYHTTAKFLARKANIPYQTLVHKFIDKIFRIHLVGIVFTPRTLGVRIRLSAAQQLIFEEKDGKICPQLSSDLISNQIQKELEGYSFKDKVHKKLNPTCKLKSDNNGIFVRSLPIPKDTCTIPATTSRAHITIACAQGVVPKQTGDDLIDIIDLEQRATTRNSNFQQDFKVLNYGVLRQFGRHAEAFVFYPNFEMVVPAKFSYFV